MKKMEMKGLTLAASLALALGTATAGAQTPSKSDYGAQSIDSKTGRGVDGGKGDVSFEDSLGAMGKTLGAALGLSNQVLDANISQGKVVTGGLV